MIGTEDPGASIGCRQTAQLPWHERLLASEYGGLIAISRAACDTAFRPQ